MNRKFKVLTIALVLVVVLLAALAGSACTTNANADDLTIQGRYGVQGQNNNADRQGLCNGDCDGTGQGNCNGDGVCNGDCDGTGQGNCNGNCSGEYDGTQSKLADGSCCNGNGTGAGRVNGCPGACNGIVNE
jgi:hypothetical protein